MRRKIRTPLVALALVFALFGAWPAVQTLGEKEEFTAVVIVNNNLGSGAGTVLIRA